MQDSDLNTMTTELCMLLEHFVNDQNLNIMFDAAILIDDVNNDKLKEWFRSLNLCIFRQLRRSTLVD